MSAVQNGVIQRISPSMISAFDGDSRYGCERRGWFKYVLGKKEPTTPEMTRGTHLHAMNEEYLKTGRILLGTPEQTAWFKAGLWFLDGLRESSFPGSQWPLWVEAPMPAGFAVEGVPVSEMSKCDLAVFREPAIIDWKTTGSIEKNGKTPGQLAKDVQLLIYAKAFHPTAWQVKLTHGYYQVDHPVHFKPVSVELSRQELDDNYGQVIIPRVAKMKEVVRATDAKDVKPNRDACRRCPHSSYCPPDKENPIMGIFAALKKPSNAATPAPTAPNALEQSIAEGVKPELRDGKPFVPFTAILPPDAPKSDPALAAKPVEGFQAIPPPKERRMKYDDVPADPPPTAPATPSAIAKAPAPVPTPPPPPAPAPEPEKRGRGRPPGAKNKPKTQPAPHFSHDPEEQRVAELETEAPTQAEKGSITFESVTVNYGLTLNMGNFNSARIDCAMTAKFQGSPDVAFAAVLEKVQANVAAEINKLEEKSKLNPNPEKK